MIIIDETFKKEVGKRLNLLRKQNNLTIEKLVENLQNKYFIDIDEKSIRRYEKGIFLPKIDNLICLADIYNTTLDFIIYGKETSDDNSLTYYDNFKRLNRLVYSLSTNFVKDDKTGKVYLELWEDEFKVYWERLQNYGVNNNYTFEKKGKDPTFSVKDLDNMFADFIDSEEQLLPTKERVDKFIKSQGIDSDIYLLQKQKKIENIVGSNTIPTAMRDGQGEK